MNSTITKEFCVNEYLTVRLEKNRTNLYVEGEFFRSCKYLLLNVDLSKSYEYDEIRSIDQAADLLDHSLELPFNEYPQIDPETEFWGHCSNLQAWYEHEYDTRLLHSALAFPLLKELTENGDPIARTVFKEEIARRFKEGYFHTLLFLVEMNYLSYLTEEERNFVFFECKDILCSFFKKCLRSKKYKGKAFLLISQLKFPHELNSIFHEHYIDFDSDISLKELYTCLGIAPLTGNEHHLFSLVSKWSAEIYRVILSHYQDVFYELTISSLHSFLMIYEMCYLLLREWGYVEYIPIERDFVEWMLDRHYSSRNQYFKLEFMSCGLVNKFAVYEKDSGLRHDFAKEFRSNIYLTTNFFDVSKILVGSDNMLITQIAEISERDQERDPQSEERLLLELIRLDDPTEDQRFQRVHNKLVELWKMGDYGSVERVLEQYESLLCHISKKPMKIYLLFMLCVKFIEGVFHFRYITKSDLKEHLTDYFAQKGFDVRLKYISEDEISSMVLFDQFQAKPHNTSSWYSLVYNLQGFYQPQDYLLDLLTEIFFADSKKRVIRIEMRGEDIELLVENDSELSNEERKEVKEHFFRKNF